MSDVNLTLQDNGGVYLAITETPAVVTLGQAVISGALASTVTVANTVTVALDSNSLIALENITVTVGSSVSISNLPATQTIAGTVTANVFGTDGAFLHQIPVVEHNSGYVAQKGVAIAWNDEQGSPDPRVVSDTFPLPIQAPQGIGISGTVTANVFGKNVNDGTPVAFPIAAGNDNFVEEGPRLGVQLLGTDGLAVGQGSLCILPISGTVTANVGSEYFSGASGVTYSLSLQSFADGGEIFPVTLDDPLPVKIFSGSVTVGNSVTIGSLPAISGTVTASVTNSVTVGSLPVQLSTTTIGGTARLNVTLSSATTVGGAAPSYANLHGGSDGTNLRAILTDTNGRTVVTGTVGVSGTVPVSGTFYQSTQPVSLTSLPSLAAGTAQIGSVTASISGTVPVSGTFWQATQPVSGTVTAAVASTTVTVSAMPSGTLTTRFGTPTTANTAFLTSAVTNTARKYLLIQNVTTASNVITVGVGFVPTTTQGIQLAAGAGITFESSYIPTGAVWVLSSVTASNHTILEA